jgi:hypothetical protein
MYRISRNGHEPIIDVDQVQAIEPVIRSSEPGRYHVDEISSDPPPSGHTSRRWGVGINRNDASVTLLLLGLVGGKSLIEHHRQPNPFLLF